MDRDAEQDVIRRAYAKQIMAAAGVSNRRIEAAFASVKREDFLGRGPWPVVRWGRGMCRRPAGIPSIFTMTWWSPSFLNATSITVSHHCMRR